MKKLMLILLIGSVATAGEWTLNVMGNRENTLVAGVGKTLFDGEAELGFSGAMYDVPDKTNDYELTIGPYLAAPLKVMGPWDGNDVGSYVGISPQFHLNSWKPILEVFAAAVLYPDRSVSPVAIWRYSWLSGDIKEDDVPDGGNILFGLRLVF